MISNINCDPDILQIEEKAADLQAAISEGANSFLFTEYKYVSIFMVSMDCQAAAGARVGGLAIGCERVGGGCVAASSGFKAFPCACRLPSLCSCSCC
jgi:Na+/H+-translocating membrane pyrophosphatase